MHLSNLVRLAFSRRGSDRRRYLVLSKLLDHPLDSDMWQITEMFLCLYDSKGSAGRSDATWRKNFERHVASTIKRSVNCLGPRKKGSFETHLNSLMNEKTDDSLHETEVRLGIVAEERN